MAVVSAVASFTISTLRQQPEFLTDAADRIWRAWWKGDGYSFEHVAGLVRTSLPSADIPHALVAHRDGRFLGTASVIESDFAARPQLTPWVAAVWVDEAFRGTGVGSALVADAVRRIFELGFETAYLCALPAKVPFYERSGWQVIEEGVEGLSVLALRDAQGK